MEVTYDPKKVFVVIPSLKQGEVTRNTVSPLIEKGYTVVVIDDSSSDDTKKALDGLPVRYFKHVLNFGEGAELRNGIEFALEKIVKEQTLYAENYLNYQTNRSWIRKTIRKIYLWQVRRHIVGNAIDFGCGIGEHLATYSKDSMGLEVNEATVRYCNANGLNVQLYKPEEDNYQLKNIPEGKFQSLVISHVLEHLTDPDVVLKKLMDSCKRVGIKRVFVTVPCEAGFAHDKTHITFITWEFIKEKGLVNYNGFRLIKHGYFPFNFKFVGRIFTYNEFYLVYDLKSD